jgi:hypothetical protein
VTIAQHFLIALLLILHVPALAHAQAGKDAFITKASPGRNVLKVDSELETPAGASTANIYITVRDIRGPSPSDRNLVAALYVKDWASEPMMYRYPFRLAQGQVAAQVEIPFAAGDGQWTWDVAIFEEGRNIEDKGRGAPGQVHFQWRHPSGAGNQFPIAFLLASDENPVTEANIQKSLAGLIVHSGVPPNNGVMALPGGTVVAAQSALRKPISVADASDDWRFYFAHSVWVASVGAIAEINQQHPQVADALRTYVSAGGALLIHGVTSSNSVDEANRLLSGSDGHAEVNFWNSISDTKEGWWWISRDALNQAAVDRMNQVGVENGTSAKRVSAEPLMDAAGLMFDAALLSETILESGLGGHRDNLASIIDALGFADPGLSQISRMRESFFSQLERHRILHRTFVHGHVLLASQPLDELPRSLVDKAISYVRVSSGWNLINSSLDGNWYLRNLITQVGKPPVIAFCAVVTLFGIVLGPGLLYLTGRLQRRSLMIFLVPVLSFVATVLIITYGIVHEGFDTYIRVSSVTVFDAPAQTAFGWSRQSYFSGLPPREGLVFPSQAFVRPVNSVGRGQGSYDPHGGSASRIEIGEQQIWRSWLRPRQHQQLLAGHSVDPGSIPIATHRSASGTLLVENRTAEMLPFVVLRDAGENYFTVLDLGGAETREGVAIDKLSATATLRKIGVAIKPQMPLELEGTSGSLLNFGRNRSTWSYNNGELEDIINRAFKQTLTSELHLQPYGFATLVPEFDGIVVPLKGKQSSNMNLVIGVDPW